jgi:hypothetical protein
MATQHILISETDFSELLKKVVVSAIKETQAHEKPDNTLLTQLQTAEKLKISIPTLNSWKEKGLLPFTQIGRKIYFKSQDVVNALDTLSNKNNKRG